MSQDLQILLIENDPGAARLTKEALREAGLGSGLVALSNGEEALRYMRGEERYRNRPDPAVIFLDLHLPKVSGLDVLRELKNSRFLATPVVIISGSADPREIRKAYELHAACYIQKPDDLDQFLRFMQIAFEFWSSVVTLPA